MLSRYYSTAILYIKWSCVLPHQWICKTKMNVYESESEFSTHWQLWTQLDTTYISARILHSVCSRLQYLRQYIWVDYTSDWIKEVHKSANF